MANSPMLRIAELFRNKEGNFAIMAALTVPLVFMAGSLAIDTTNALSMKVRMQNAVDSAALATVTRLTQEDDLSVADAKIFAATFLQGQIEEDLPVFTNMSVQPTITITPVDEGGNTIWRVAVAMTGTQALTPMARLMGQENLTVNVIGKSEGGSSVAQGSFSMALVLDRSGSMDWDLDGQRKIDVLKTAVGGLLTQLETADPDRQFVRIGASSYNTNLTGSQRLSWNPGKTREFVNALPASGGTDSTDAFSWGYNSVTANKETRKHAERTGQVPEKFMVFMTDGDNNYSSADSSTKILCDKAKADDVEVYTVAFAAPSRGKKLLSYCASSADHFFDAENSAELIAAFKSIGLQASKIVARLTE